ncbi:MAG: DUF4269 domain-containing protein [Robiginitomaculum sp.]|nr:DUF4269 domain-containing protein [Robiginitomaculum sp.]
MYSHEQVALLLSRLGVMQALEQYSPCWIGSSALDVRHAQSDVDLVCSTTSLDEFTKVTKTAFGKFDQFQQSLNVFLGRPSMFVEFNVNQWPVDVFAREHPVAHHPCWQVFEVERQLLELGSPGLREKVRELKRSGMRTEAAFMHCLGLEGRAFETILSLYGKPKAVLSDILFYAGW